MEERSRRGKRTSDYIPQVIAQLKASFCVFEPVYREKGASWVAGIPEDRSPTPASPNRLAERKRSASCKGLGASAGTGSTKAQPRVIKVPEMHPFCFRCVHPLSYQSPTAQASCSKAAAHIGTWANCQSLPEMGFRSPSRSPSLSQLRLSFPRNFFIYSDYDNQRPTATESSAKSVARCSIYANATRIFDKQCVAKSTTQLCDCGW